jgi:glucose-6-phosphate isomerase
MYAGHNISSTYLHVFFEVLEGKDVSVNIISKSGTTIEPAISFRLLNAFFIYAWKRALDPKTAAEYAYILHGRKVR